MSEIYLDVLSGSQTYSDSVGFPHLDDTYNFSLDRPSSLSVSLTPGYGSVSWSIADSGGNIIQSGLANDVSEALKFYGLPADDYSLKVSYAGQNTDYTLDIDPITGLEADSGYFVVKDSQVSIDFILDGGAYKGEVGLFNLEGMHLYKPGSEAFIKQATRRSLSGSHLGHVAISDSVDKALFDVNYPLDQSSNHGTYNGVKLLPMNPGDKFAIILVPNGTIEEVFQNPSIGGDKQPLFSLGDSNPGGAFHVGQLAAAGGNIFVMEDQRVDLGSDRDYNDVLFQVKGDNELKDLTAGKYELKAVGYDRTEETIEAWPIGDRSERDLLTGDRTVIHAIAGLTEVNGDPLLDKHTWVGASESDSHQGHLISITESPPEPTPNNSNKNYDDLEFDTQDLESYSHLTEWHEDLPWVRVNHKYGFGEIELTYSSEESNPDTTAPKNLNLETNPEIGEIASNSTAKQAEPNWKYSIYYYIPTINVDLSDLQQETNADSTNKNDANLEANPHNPQHGGGASDSRAKRAEPIWEYTIPFSTSKINIDLTDLWKEPNPSLEINPTNPQYGEIYLDSSEKQILHYKDGLGQEVRRGEWHSPSTTALTNIRNAINPSGEIYITGEEPIADSRGFLGSGLEKSDSEIELILNTAIENIKTAVADKNIHDRRLALIPIAKELNSLLLDSPLRSDRESISFQKPEDFAQNIGMGASALAEAEFNREIQSPHIIGPPLAYSEETFVARTGISSQIEQTTLDRRRRPLLLYGQRRMGKTSLLNNLGRLLPENIIPLFVDLQGPASLASNNTGFLYNIARGMVKSAQTQSDLSLPQLTRQSLAADPFTVFDEWLDRVEETMGEKTALLALDEFEALEGAIAKKRFDPEEVLGMLRNLIQHRPRFKVLLAGSHAIEEFQPWASYLINVQVVKIGYLKESEARQLVERPVKDFALQYEPDAVERILYLTRCHPFLVQLLCEEIVAFKNEQSPTSRRLATVADVEAAVPAALSSGSFFFADIKTNQISCLGSEVLQFIAARGEGAIIDRSALSRQFPCNLDSTLENLLRRELIEEADNGGYRFQVESIRRSFV